MSLRRRALMKQEGLPAEYERVKYLETNGKQFIDTGVAYCGQDIGFRMFANRYISDQQYFGTSHSNFRECYFDTYADHYYIGIRGIETGLSFTMFPFVNYLVFKTDIGNRLMYLNSTSFPIRIGPLECSGKGVIIGARYGSSTYFNGKIYSFIITNGFNGVPAIRNFDGKPGMFNTIDGTFLINNGTGEFGYEKLDGTYVAPI